MNHKHKYYKQNEQKSVLFPDMKFAVISDLHYYDASLGTSGSAFEDYVKTDRKLLADSSYIVSFAVDEIIKSGVEFVLVAGDITKDGELLCHRKAAKELSRLNEKGIKVFVVPGNHDINNLSACKYENDRMIPVTGITSSQFTEIYDEFGYKAALYRDINSLSYVAEPVKGLWLVALDTCCFRKNKLGQLEYKGGIINQSRLYWLKSILQKAKSSGKAVIVLQHYAITEHWKGQKKIHPEYLLRDFEHVGGMMAAYGVTLCFTGHYHSHDITLKKYKDDSCLYDLLTGSLVTPPCPIRYCKITGNMLEVTTENLIEKLPGGSEYAEKGNRIVYNVIFNEALNKLSKYKVSEKDACYIAEHFSLAFMAHIRGDENVSDRPPFDTGKLGLWGRIVYSIQKYVMDSMWKDLPPPDNNIVIDLCNKDWHEFVR